MSESKLVHVKLPKCDLYLSNSELLSLLKYDKEIWKKAISRGKVINRAKRFENVGQHKIDDKMMRYKNE